MDNFLENSHVFFNTAILYITFLMLFLVILEGNKTGIVPRKIFLSDDEILPFERYNAP